AFWIENAAHSSSLAFRECTPQLWFAFVGAVRSISTCHNQGVAMQNGARTNMRTHQPRPAASFAPRSRRWTSNAARPESKGSENAQRNYERYLALAQAEAQAGNLIGAENYYQYAEHYFRSMSSDRGTTLEDSVTTGANEAAGSLEFATGKLPVSLFSGDVP